VVQRRVYLRFTYLDDGRCWEGMMEGGYSSIVGFYGW
jgi:hypothetical protein